MILRLRQACTHAALVLNTFENDDSQTTGGYAEADPNTCYMSVLSSNDAFFSEGKRYFPSKRDKYGNVLLNKRTELVDDFNIN
jgi:hypothetical protein